MSPRYDLVITSWHPEALHAGEDLLCGLGIGLIPDLASLWMLVGRETDRADVPICEARGRGKGQ